MSSEKHPAGRSGHVCPACGHAVPTMVERHKTMGVYVPVYREGPCDNEDCRRGRADTGPVPQKDGRAEGERVTEGGS